jgi:hypothetical protein
VIIGEISTAWIDGGKKSAESPGTVYFSVWGLDDGLILLDKSKLPPVLFTHLRTWID